MQEGTVAWFEPVKGYGFIAPADRSKDIFVHITAVQRAGLGSLKQGQKLQFEIDQQNGRKSAVNLAALD